MPWPLRMTLISAGLMTLFFLYALVRFWWSVNMTNLQHKRTYKILSLLTGMLFFFYPAWGYFSFLSTGTFVLHSYPAAVKYLFWFGFIFSGVMLSWVLFLDLSRLMLKYVFKIKQPQLDTLFAWLMIGVTLLVLGYTAVKTVWHTNTIQEHVVKYTPDVSSEKPIRIVHISDLHVDKYTNGEKLNRYVQRVRETNPDIIIFTGDLITSGQDYVEEAAVALASIEVTHGIYAVLGDHDYWSGEEEIVEALEQKGIRVLRNENSRVDVNGTAVKLTGITEIYSSRPGNEEIEGLVSDSGSEALKILFAHQASDRLIRYARESGTDLLLGGHTHGGQIRIPIFFYPVTAVMEETRFIRRDYKLDNLLLNVNSGLGFTLSPVRYNAPADYSVIDIR